MNTEVVVVVLLLLITANGSSQQISPSPSPEPNVGSGGIVSDALTEQRCSNSSTTSCHDLKNMTACLNGSSSAASKDLFLLIQNDGEDALQANVTILDIDVTFPVIRVSKHQAKRIKIVANIEGSPSIIINAGNGKCIIHIGSLKGDSEFYKQFTTHLSPIYGAYFLFFIVLIAGGTWACCKIGKNEQQVDGARYQELEMAEPANNSVNDEEMAVGWNQDWGDDCEEPWEAKSTNAHQNENHSANGHTSRTSDKGGWENEWDD
ncbi:hypothetical protein JCGZ_03316 [Jatropha curcas]|uniref:DUF7356 domain-containing protein n=1 Tax=Jatropha curcas TaxID=180498 RepID=A0A067JNS0_JATCU|nr:uncharacterized protein LOC105649174 [Jatropha curcas]KDP21645.1 hypothetical protein JCGZ_03316 [Jatropha curcas]